MANPPSGFWPVREKEITLSVAGANIITESDLGVKPDGVFNTHTITVILVNDGGGGASSWYLDGASMTDSTGAFVYTTLIDSGAPATSGEGFVVDPMADGSYKAFRITTVNSTVASKAYIRSSIRGL